MKATPHQVSKKTFNNHGKWMERPRQSEILICTCGNKYIKTRANQLTCVRCIIA